MFRLDPDSKMFSLFLFFGLFASPAFAARGYGMCLPGWEWVSYLLRFYLSR